MKIQIAIFNHLLLLLLYCIQSWNEKHDNITQIITKLVSLTLTTAVLFDTVIPLLIYPKKNNQQYL